MNTVICGDFDYLVMCKNYVYSIGNYIISVLFLLITNLLILNFHSQFMSSEQYKIVYTHFYLKYTRLTLLHHIEYIYYTHFISYV